MPFSRTTPLQLTRTPSPPDGRWAVGYTSYSYEEIATLWDTTTGEVWDLNDLFTTTFNVDLDGWTLHFATGISADGLTLSGWGLNPDGNHEGWIATMSSHPTSVPEPATYAALVGALALGLAAARKRRGSFV